jgi:hypothetical protein
MAETTAHLLSFVGPDFSSFSFPAAGHPFAPFNILLYSMDIQLSLAPLPFLIQELIRAQPSH